MLLQVTTVRVSSNTILHVVKINKLFFHTATIYKFPFKQLLNNCTFTKITNDSLTRSGTGCFIAVPIWQQRASKCLTKNLTKVKPIITVLQDMKRSNGRYQVICECDTHTHTHHVSSVSVDIAITLATYLDLN